ncbi:hypothetical protein QFZ35_000078 [Arthrobacter ulcerisalmonis]|nr:hypothetical protein [Arthrobacter ulcerisalmonis]MDQ0661580.1 hypothetical protein [Arthrobacter ulcerisalmonis]
MRVNYPQLHSKRSVMHRELLLAGVTFAARAILSLRTSNSGI